MYLFYLNLGIQQYFRILFLSGATLSAQKRFKNVASTLAFTSCERFWNITLENLSNVSSKTLKESFMKTLIQRLLNVPNVDQTLIKCF